MYANENTYVHEASHLYRSDAMRLPKSRVPLKSDEGNEYDNVVDGILLLPTREKTIKKNIPLFRAYPPYRNKAYKCHTP